MTLTLTLACLTLVAGGTVSLLVYRLLFHPLSSFPGPKLAAVTSLYQVYYDVYRGGQFLDKLKELHAIYGVLY